MEEKQKCYLFETAKWEKFLGVLTVISTVLVAVIGIVFIACSGMLGKFAPDAAESAANAGKITYIAIGVLYLALAVVMQFPAKFLLKSAKALKSGLVSEDEAAITDAFKNGKSYFKFTAIYTLVGLAIAAVVIIVTFAILAVAVA